MRKKEKRNFVGGGVIVVLLVGIALGVGYFGFGWFNASANYLISVTAESGVTITDGEKAGCFELTLEGSDHIVFFSDRPVREAIRMTPSDLLSVWKKEFVGNPPNADLQLFDKGRGDELVIVALESTPIWDEDAQSLTFERACLISLISDDSFKKDDLLIVTDSGSILSGRFEKGALFIDNVVIDKKPWEERPSGPISSDPIMFRKAPEPGPRKPERPIYLEEYPFDEKIPDDFGDAKVESVPDLD